MRRKQFLSVICSRVSLAAVGIVSLTAVGMLGIVPPPARAEITATDAADLSDDGPVGSCVVKFTKAVQGYNPKYLYEDGTDGSSHEGLAKDWNQLKWWDWKDCDFSSLVNHTIHVTGSREFGVPGDKHTWTLGFDLEVTDNRENPSWASDNEVSYSDVPTAYTSGDPHHRITRTDPRLNSGWGLLGRRYYPLDDRPRPWTPSSTTGAYEIPDPHKIAVTMNGSLPDDKGYNFTFKLSNITLTSLDATATTRKPYVRIVVGDAEQFNNSNDFLRIVSNKGNVSKFASLTGSINHVVTEDSGSSVSCENLTTANGYSLAELPANKYTSNYSRGSVRGIKTDNQGNPILTNGRVTPQAKCYKTGNASFSSDTTTSPVTLNNNYSGIELHNPNGSAENLYRVKLTQEDMGSSTQEANIRVTSYAKRKNAIAFASTFSLDSEKPAQIGVENPNKPCSTPADRQKVKEQFKAKNPGLTDRTIEVKEDPANSGKCKVIVHDSDTYSDKVWNHEDLSYGYSINPPTCINVADGGVVASDQLQRLYANLRTANPAGTVDEHQRPELVADSSTVHLNNGVVSVDGGENSGNPQYASADFNLHSLACSDYSDTVPTEDNSHTPSDTGGGVAPDPNPSPSSSPSPSTSPSPSPNPSASPSPNPSTSPSASPSPSPSPSQNPGDKTNPAERTVINPPKYTPVRDPKHLTAAEKEAVRQAVLKANPGLIGAEILVNINGSVEVNGHPVYLPGSKAPVAFVYQISKLPETGSNARDIGTLAAFALLLSALTFMLRKKLAHKGKHRATGKITS